MGGTRLEISAKELRGKPGQIIEQAARGTEVVITMRGKKMAKLIPYSKKSHGSDTEKNTEDAIFGLWKERGPFMSVESHVRALRKGRKY
jgi:prevent-host-death family protein